MEWWTGLALLPALMCALMMGGMALAAAFGLRRTQDNVRRWTSWDEPTTYDEDVEPRQDVLR